MIMFLAALISLALVGPEDGCLSSISASSNTGISEFDRHNDLVNGNSVSCSMSMMPVEVQRDLEEIRLAVKQRNTAQLSIFLKFPVYVSRDDGNDFEITESNIESYSDDIFSFLDKSVDLMEVSNLELAGWRGASLAHGTIWFNPTKSSTGRYSLQISAIGPVD